MFLYAIVSEQATAGLQSVDLHTLAHIGLAVLLGISVGMERQWRQRAAGLRTNTLVCLGAAAFVDLAGRVNEAAAGRTQVIAYVVSGVGFLGAGAIMKEGANIRGLNTAATLWCSAAIGSCAGAGQWIPAIFIAVIVIAVNLFLRPLTHVIDRLSGTAALEAAASYSIRIVCTDAEEANARLTLVTGIAEAGLTLHELDSENSDEEGSVEILAHVAAITRSDASIERLAGRLSLEPNVTAVNWRVLVGEEA